MQNSTSRSLTPMTRSSLQKLYNQKQEAEDAERISRTVSGIYNCTLREAETNSTITKFMYPLHKSDGFYTPKRIDLVLKALKPLFPDCSISKKQDPVNPQLIHIAVDWS